MSYKEEYRSDVQYFQYFGLIEFDEIDAVTWRKWDSRKMIWQLIGGNGVSWKNNPFELRKWGAVKGSLEY